MSQTLAPVVSAIHGYDVAAALTYIKNGELLEQVLHLLVAQSSRRSGGTRAVRTSTGELEPDDANPVPWPMYAPRGDRHCHRQAAACRWLSARLTFGR